MEEDGRASGGVVVQQLEVKEAAIRHRKGKESRRKRKERESGDEVRDDGVGEKKKKRRDGKERRSERDARNGTEKKQRREGRVKMDSRKGKNPKDRMVESDGGNRKASEGKDDLTRGMGGVTQEKVDTLEENGHRKESCDLDDRVSRDSTADRNFAGAYGMEYAVVADKSPASSLLVEDKEEGEILDEDSCPSKAPDSDLESGEILSRGKADISSEGFDRANASPHNSFGRLEESRWGSSPAETTNSASEICMLQRNGNSMVKDALDEPWNSVQVMTPNLLQSVLVLAEAYDSESPVSNEKFGSSSVGDLDSVLVSSKKARNGRKSAVEKGQHQDLNPKEQSIGPPDQRNDDLEDKGVKHEEEDSTLRFEGNRVISSRVHERIQGRHLEKADAKDAQTLDNSQKRPAPYSSSPAIEDVRRVAKSRGDMASGRQSLPGKDRGQKSKRRPSRSQDGRHERLHSQSFDSIEVGEPSRRRSYSPDAARGRSSKRDSPPPREILRERRTVAVDTLEQRKRSRSRESGSERKHPRDFEKSGLKGLSRSRANGRTMSSARGGSADRRPRSRSRDGLGERNRDASRRTDTVERHRKSSIRNVRDQRNDDRMAGKHADGLERRRRSSSWDAMRDRQADEMDGARHARLGDELSRKSSKDGLGANDGRHYGSSRNGRDVSKKNTQDEDFQQSVREAARDEENQEEYQERVASQLAAQEEDDVERVKEESRRRRQAILEKYKKQQNKDIDVQHGSIPGENANGSAEKLDIASHTSASADQVPIHHSAPPDVVLSLGKAVAHNGNLLQPANKEFGGHVACSPKTERSSDMFCDDIFGDSPAGGRRLGRGDGLAMDTSGLIDNWDDAEGYYCFRIGEVLDGRYEVAFLHGRGVFSTVVRARDKKAGRGEPEEVAIKIIRNNETMYKAGQQELVILNKLAGADPENKRHCVRLLSSFEYRSHLCLVFESLHMNLREVLKKFGRNIGINLHAVQAYAKQLFISLKHLRNCGVLHCDVKPDNMLVNESKNVLKLCDFGSAMFAGENEITPYLVSRFYRAPEIILGLPYDHALDIWSVGCCLFELYTGKMLFPGHTNNDMLRLHMELKGPFPKKMLKKAAFADQHFDQDYSFCAIEEDPVTKKAIKRILMNVKPRDIGVLVSGSGTIDEDSRMLATFKDMLEKIFILDPDKRLTVSQALSHSFISGK